MLFEFLKLGVFCPFCIVRWGCIPNIAQNLVDLQNSAPEWFRVIERHSATAQLLRLCWYGKTKLYVTHTVLKIALSPILWSTHPGADLIAFWPNSSQILSTLLCSFILNMLFNLKVEFFLQFHSILFPNSPQQYQQLLVV